MKEVLPTKLVIGKIRNGKKQNRDERNASYIVREPDKARDLLVQVSDKGGWDHVQISVYASRRWEVSTQEIQFVRDLVFKPEEVVVEFHNQREGYINNGDVTTHLWHKQGEEFEQPPLELL